MGFKLSTSSWWCIALSVPTASDLLAVAIFAFVWCESALKSIGHWRLNECGELKHLVCNLIIGCSAAHLRFILFLSLYDMKSMIVLRDSQPLAAFLFYPQSPYLHVLPWLLTPDSDCMSVHGWWLGLTCNNSHSQLYRPSTGPVYQCNITSNSQTQHPRTPIS